MAYGGMECAPGGIYGTCQLSSSFLGPIPILLSSRLFIYRELSNKATLSSDWPSDASIDGRSPKRQRQQQQHTLDRYGWHEPCCACQRASSCSSRPIYASRSSSHSEARSEIERPSPSASASCERKGMQTEVWANNSRKNGGKVAW